MLLTEKMCLLCGVEPGIHIYKARACGPSGTSTLICEKCKLKQDYEAVVTALKSFVKSRQVIEPAIQSHEAKDFCGCNGCVLRKMFDRAEKALKDIGVVCEHETVRLDGICLTCGENLSDMKAT